MGRPQCCHSPPHRNSQVSIPPFFFFLLSCPPEPLHSPCWPQPIPGCSAVVPGTAGGVGDNRAQLEEVSSHLLCHTRGTQPRSRCLYSSFQQKSSEALLVFPGPNPWHGVAEGVRRMAALPTRSPPVPAAPQQEHPKCGGARGAGMVQTVRQELLGPKPASCEPGSASKGAPSTAWLCLHLPCESAGMDLAEPGAPWAVCVRCPFREGRPGLSALSLPGHGVTSRAPLPGTSRAGGLGTRLV